MFRVLNGGETFCEPPLEEQESAVDAREDAAVHQQVAEVGGCPPVREVLEGIVVERNMPGGARRFSFRCSSTPFSWISRRAFVVSSGRMSQAWCIWFMGGAMSRPR